MFGPRTLLCSAFLWAAVGLGLALAAPWLGTADGVPVGWINVAAPAITAVFIALTVVAAVRVVGRTGHTLHALPWAAAQFVLFTLLFFQIACHAGMSHFAADGPPRWWDWLAFSAAHAVRAGDLLDVVEGFRLDIQPVHHATTLTSTAVVAFHVVMGLFVVSLFAEYVGRFWGAVRKDRGVRGAIRAGLAMVTVIA